MLKLSTKMNQVFWEKNLENENFITAAIHRENWYFKKTNIFHYFPSKNLKYSQIFLSETIHGQENGSRGPHFAKSLNSNFLKGLTYSALLSFLSSCSIIVISSFILHDFLAKRVRDKKNTIFIIMNVSWFKRIGIVAHNHPCHSHPHQGPNTSHQGNLSKTMAYISGVAAFPNASNVGWI